MRTDRVDGWPFDHGFQVFDTGHPEPRRLLSGRDREALLLHTLPNGALVRLGDTFYRLGDPRQRPADLPGALRAPIGGLRDKANLAAFLLRMRLTRGDQLLRRDGTQRLRRLSGRGTSARNHRRAVASLSCGSPARRRVDDVEPLPRTRVA